MAALLSQDPETRRSVRAVDAVYGIYDLIDWWGVTQSRPEDPVGKLMGKPPSEALDAYLSFSALHCLQAQGVNPATRYLIVYGDEDTIVRPSQSARFVAALRESGANVESLLVPGAGHSWFTYLDDHPARRRVDEEPNLAVAPVLLRFLERSLASC
jgi:dipeptidyl aminopeptidase/acylaminoacyl peptidase